MYIILNDIIISLVTATLIYTSDKTSNTEDQAKYSFINFF